MLRNPILEEIWAVREKLLREHGNDLDKVWDHVDEQAAASGHPSAKPQPRYIEKPAANRKKKASKPVKAAKKTAQRKRSA